MRPAHGVLQLVGVVETALRDRARRNAIAVEVDSVELDDGQRGKRICNCAPRQPEGEADAAIRQTEFVHYRGAEDVGLDDARVVGGAVLIGIEPGQLVREVDYVERSAVAGADEAKVERVLRVDDVVALDIDLGRVGVGAKVTLYRSHFNRAAIDAGYRVRSQVNRGAGVIGVDRSNQANRKR